MLSCCYGYSSYISNAVPPYQCYRVAMVTFPECVTQCRHIDYVTSVLLKLPCDVTTFLDGGPINRKVGRSHVKTLHYFTYYLLLSGRRYVLTR
jgi:hypothetical protein